jgi:hypothetical protein
MVASTYLGGSTWTKGWFQSPTWAWGAQPILVHAAKAKPRVSLGPSLRKFGGKGFPLGHWPWRLGGQVIPVPLRLCKE